MRNTATINLIADVVAPFAVIIVTVVLFFVFIPEEPGALFWTNLVYSVVLEAILFAYLFWLPKTGDSVALKWMCGVYSIVYICAALIWMLLFGAILSHWVSIKVYYAVIAVLTVVWILVGALSFKADNVNEHATATMGFNRREVDRVRINADMLLQQFSLLAVSTPGLQKASVAVTSLCRGLSTLSPTAMSDPSTSSRIVQLVAGLEQILNDPISDSTADNLKSYSERALINLNSIKKSILK